MIDNREGARWRRIVDALRAEAARMADPRARARKQVEIGDTLLRNLRDAHGAADAWLAAIEAWPEQPDEPLHRLERLARDSKDGKLYQRWVAGLRRAGRWTAVIDLMGRRADALRDPRKRCKLRLEAARLCAEKRGDVASARRLLIAAAEDADRSLLDRVQRPLSAHLRETPHDEEAATTLARLLARCERPDEAIELLVDTTLHLRDLTRKAALLYEAAFLCERAGRLERAPGLLRDTLVFDPRREAEVVARLEALEQARPDPLTAEALLGALIDAWDGLERPQRSQRLLAERVAAASGRAAIDLRLRQARHAEEVLGDNGRAFELYQAAAVARDPAPAIDGMRRTGQGRPGAFEVIADLCTRHGLDQALAELCTDEAALRVDDGERAALLHRAGTIHEAAGDIERAMARFVEAFKLRPRERAYLEAGKRLYRRQGDWAMVDRLMGLEVDVLDDEGSRRAVRVEQARLRREKLADGLGAYDALRDALRRLGETTAEDGAFDMLEQLVADPVSFEAIAGGLRTRAETEPDGAHRLVELAGLHLDLRGEPQIGLDLLREAIDRDPSDGPLFTDVAARVGRHAGPEAEARVQRGALSRPLSMQTRLAAGRRAARLYARIDPAEALAVWCALAALDPHDGDAIDGAIAAAEGLGPVAATTVVELLKERLDGDTQPDPDQRIRWQRALAHAEGRRVAPDDERAAWLGLLDRVPDDPEALAAVRPMLDGPAWAARLAAAVAASERSGGLADDHREALAALHEQAGRPGEAARWLLPLALRPAETALRDRVFALYAAAGDRRSALDLARQATRQLDAARPDDDPDEESTAVGAAPLDPHTRAAARLDVATRLVALAEAEGDDGALTIGLLALSDERTDDTHAALRLAEVARRTGDTDALLVALGRLSTLTPGPRGVSLRREIARLLTGHRDDRAAIDAWRAVVADAPDDPEALATLQKLHGRAGDDQTVHRLLWQRQATADDPAERVALLREAAVVAEFRLGSTHEAMRAWRGVLELEPHNADALDEMIRLTEDEGDFRATLSAARVRVDQLRGADRADLARHMAEICAGPLGDDPGAVVWWHIVVEEEPDDGEALEALAADAERRGAADMALMLWSRLAAGRPGRVRQVALRRRAELLQDADDPAGAMQAWRALAAARPDDPEPWRALEAVATAAEDWPAVAEALAGRIARTSGDERHEAVRARARLLDATGDDGAVAAWRAVLEIDPHDAEALAACAGLYGALGRPLEMLRALDMLVAVAERAQGIGRLAAAAEQMEAAGDARTAFECWRRVHHLRGEVDGESLDAMRRLAGPAERWNAFAEALAESAGRSDAVDAQRAFMLEAAAVWADRLGDDRRAFTQVQAACALDPAHPDALARLELLAAALDDDTAWAGLSEALIQGAEAAPERRARLLMRAAELNERHRRRAGIAFALLSRAFEGPDCVGELSVAVEQALVRLARRGSRWAEVVELFDARARVLEAPAEQAALLHRLGMVLERDAGRAEAAFEQYLLAVQLAPLDRSIRDSAHRLAHTLDMWSVVERVLRLALENAEGPRARAAVLRVIAELQAGPLQDEAESYATLKRAFATAPGEAENREAVEAAAAARGTTAELAAFYEDEAGWAGSNDDRIALYRAAAAAYTQHGQQVEAARVLRKLDRLLPGDADLTEERLELLRLAADARPLAAALEAQIERSQGARRMALLRELATVRAERLADAPGAEAAWQRILDARPHDEHAFTALTDSLTARRDWARLDAVLAERIEHTAAATRRALMRRRAELLHSRRGRPVEAFDLLADVMRAEPSDLDLLDTLARRAPIAEAWGELVACAERAVAVAPRARVDAVLLLIGRTARDRLDDPRKALSALTRALEHRPDDLELAREVAPLMQQRRQFGPLVELHRRFGPPLVAEPGEHPVVVHARWALSLSALLADRLYRVDEAIEVLRELMARQSLNTDVARRLRALCERAQDGPGLHDAIERLAGLATGVERLSTLVDGARALAGIGEGERAVAVWRTVLTEAPGHPEAQRAVARQAARQEDWALMIEQLEARIRAAHGPEERADLLCELAVLHQHRRGDRAAAAAAYDRALGAAPEHVDALVGHVELHRRAADPATLGGLAERIEAQLDRGSGRAALEPLYVDLQLERVAALRADGHGDGGLPILEALAGRVTDDRVGQALADALYDAGRLRDAAALYAELPMPPADPADEGEGRAKQHVRRARALRAAGLDEPAMRHFDAATNHPATRACALEQLANLQERAGRWEAAARLREKLAEAVDDPQAKRAAWVAAGLILEHRLGRAVRAMQAYDRAVDAGLGEPMLLGGILRLYRQQARPDRVLQVSERLLAGDSGDRRRAELWCDRAWALDASGDRRGAREARRIALGHDPASPEAAEQVLVGLERAGDVERVETLDAARGALDALEGEARVPLLVALRDWSIARAAALRTPAVHDDSDAIHDDSDAIHDDSDAIHDDSDAIHDDFDAIHDDSDAIHDDSAAVPHDAEGPDTAPPSPVGSVDGSVDGLPSLDASELELLSVDDLLESVELESVDALDAAGFVSVDDGSSAGPDEHGTLDSPRPAPADPRADDISTDAPAEVAPVEPTPPDPAVIAALDADAEAFAAELVALRPDDHGHRQQLARLISARAERAPDAMAAREISRAAIEHRRAAARLRPGDTDDLRAFAETCAAAGVPRWGLPARSLLALIGAGDAPPPLHAELPRLDAVARKKHLAGAAWRSPAGLLLNALHAWIARPLDALLREAKGERGRPAAEVHAALNAEALAVAAAIGMGFAEIRIDPECDVAVDLAGLAPPVPVIGRPVLEIGDVATRRFVLARGFELMRGCAAHAAYVPAAEARALFAGAVALARPEGGAEFALEVDAPAERVAWWAELLNGLLDGRRLDALARFAGPVAEGPRDAFARWTEGTRRAADRVGLWIAGEAGPVMEHLWRAEGAAPETRPASPRGLRMLVETSPRAAAIHRAVFGEAFGALLLADAPQTLDPPADEAASTTAEGPSLDEVAAELAAAAARGEVVERPAAIERLDAETGPPDEALDSFDGRSDDDRSDDDRSDVDLSTPSGPGDAADPPSFDEGPSTPPAEPDASDEPDELDRPTVEVGMPLLEPEPADAGFELSAPFDPSSSGDALEAVTVRRSPPREESVAPARRDGLDPAPATSPPMIEGRASAAPVELDAPRMAPEDLAPTTTPPGPIGGPLADALLDDVVSPADLGAAAEAGPPMGLDGEAASVSIVGAAEPGPAHALPGLDHLFDDLDGLLLDAEGDPTDTTHRAALLPALLPPEPAGERVDTALDAAPLIADALDRGTVDDIALPFATPDESADAPPEASMITAITRIGPADDPSEQTRDEAPDDDGSDGR